MPNRRGHRRLRSRRASASESGLFWFVRPAAVVVVSISIVAAAAAEVADGLAAAVAVVDARGNNWHPNDVS